MPTHDPAAAETTEIPTLDEYRLTVRTWLGTVQIPAASGDLEDRFARLRNWQRVLHAAGYVGVSWPRSWGGSGLTPLHQLVLNEELSRARAPQAIGLIGLDVVGPSIAKYGTPAQRELLPALLAGDHIWCQGFSEPDAGSDLAAITTKATLDGEQFIISGTKTWTSWGHKADRCALLARTGSAGGHSGLTYFIVDMRSPGISARPIRQMTGESEFCQLFFDDVFVPAENVVGRVDQGWEIAMDTLSHERGSYAMRRRVEIGLAFDDGVDAIAAATASDLSRMPDRLLESLGASVVALEVLSAQNHATAERAMRARVPSPLDSVDKLILSWTEQQVMHSLYQFLGEAALTDATTSLGLDAARVTSDFLYSRAASIYGGSSQIQLNIVAERLLGLPKGS
jgi:alkylation response protein AidB-like acyl-CoA dehydrogenase